MALYEEQNGRVTYTEAYYEELRRGMDMAVEDLGNRDQNFEAEVMMCAAWAIDRLRRERDALKRTQVAWEETARQYADGMAFYRGVVQQTGELLGRAARTADDGSECDSVLALKVPELVEVVVRDVLANQGSLPWDTSMPPEFWDGYPPKKFTK